MPKNTWEAPVMGALSTVMGFALVWHIWWLVIVSGIAIFATFMARIFNNDVDYYVPAAEVERIEREVQKRAEMQA